MLAFHFDVVPFQQFFVLIENKKASVFERQMRKFYLMKDASFSF
jgi:hypothetical protein